MTLSKNTVKYILMLLGFVIFLAGYFLVYMDFTEKTDAATAAIEELNQRLAVLNGYKAELDKYKAGIEEKKASVNDILGRYYSDEQPEDFLMLAVAMENEITPGAGGAPFAVNSMTFAEPVLVCSINGIEDGETADDPVAPRELKCYMLSSKLNATMKYDQMKQALDFIGRQKDVTKLNRLDLNYDSSTGYINGAFVLDKYYITGRDIPAHQAVIPYTDFGKSVLMGS